MMITREKQPDQPKDLRSSASNGAPASTTTKGTGRRIVALVAAMRPKQWTKNLALFVGIIFAQRLLSFSSFERAFVAFVAFCLASSSIYLLNDLLDLENDRQHPVKCKRPLASGALPASWAVVAIGMLILACGGLTLLTVMIPIEAQTHPPASLAVANHVLALCFGSSLCPLAVYLHPC